MNGKSTSEANTTAAFMPEVISYTSLSEFHLRTMFLVKGQKSFVLFEEVAKQGASSHGRKCEGALLFE